MAFEEERQRAAGEVVLSPQIHAVQDGVAFRVQGGVVRRRDPGIDACSVGFVARGERAVHLGSSQQVREQLVGNIDLHRRRHERLPVLFGQTPQLRARRQATTLRSAARSHCSGTKA